MGDPELPWQIKLALVEEIGLIDLPGVRPTEVYNFPRPSAQNVLFPCVQVTSAGEKEEFDGGSSTLYALTDWGFRVYYCDRAAETPEAEQLLLSRRKRLLDAIRLNYRGFLAGMKKRVPQVMRIRLRALPQIDELLAGLPEYQILAGGFVVRIQAAEGRREDG